MFGHLNEISMRRFWLYMSKLWIYMYNWPQRQCISMELVHVNSYGKGQYYVHGKWEYMSTVYGIRGTARDWFSSYMSNRFQFALFNNFVSDCKKIECGVPQDFILGPLFSLIYINDLSSLSKLFMPILDKFALYKVFIHYNVSIHIFPNNIYIYVYDWTQRLCIGMELIHVND